MPDTSTIATRFIASCNGDKDLAMEVMAQLLVLLDAGVSIGALRLTKEGKEFAEKYLQFIRD